MAKKKLSPEEQKKKDRQDLFDKAKEKAGEDGMHFIEDVIAFMPCGKTTFYERFPVESNELNTIKSILNKNRIQTKLEIRQKLKKGDKAAELIALYKLIATQEERDALSMQRFDHTTKGKEIKQPAGIDYSKLSTETLKDLQKNTLNEDEEK